MLKLNRSPFPLSANHFPVSPNDLPVRVEKNRNNYLNCKEKNFSFFYLIPSSRGMGGKTMTISADTESHLNNQIEEQKKQINTKDQQLEQERKKKSPYKDWIQLDRNIGIDALYSLMCNHPTSAKIFLLFIKFIGNSNSVIISNSLLQELSGLKKSAVYSALQYLQEHNYLKTIPIGHGVVAYTVNPEICWHSYGNRVKTAEFNAKVVIDAEIDGKKIADYLKNQKKIFAPSISSASNIEVKSSIEEPIQDELPF